MFSAPSKSIEHSNIQVQTDTEKGRSNKTINAVLVRMKAEDEEISRYGCHTRLK